MDRMSYSTYLIVSLCLLAILLPACTEPTDTLEVTAVPIGPDEAARHEELDRIIELEQAKTERLTELISRAQNLMADGNFEGALGEIDAMLELDPENNYALTVREPLQGFLLEQAERGVRTEPIPWQGGPPPGYPEDWPVVSRPRLAGIDNYEHESEEDRRVYQELKKKYTRFDFDDVDVETVIDYFTKVSNISFDVRWDVLAEVGIAPEATVKIYLRNVTLEKALKTVLDDTGRSVSLGFEIGDDGVITISTKADLAADAAEESDAPATAEESDEPAAPDAPAESSTEE